MSEIDWTKDVQVAHEYNNEWEDFIVLYRNEDHAYGHCASEPRRDASRWHDGAWRFRNKPLEPKPVQAILKMFRSPNQGLVMKCYLKNDATTVASVRRWHEDTEGELLDVIEVDLHNVEGLEGGK